MLSYERIIALVFALGLLLAGALSANAQSYETALAGFTKDSFNDTDSAITAVAASGNPLALDVIQALQDGRLSYSGDKVFIRDKAGAIIDAATGKPAAAAPANLAPVRLNNRLRRTVEAALGGLTLMSADPAKRYEAAQAVFKSREAAALPTLDAALAKETDARVKRALSEARAAVILFQANAAENDKLGAVGGDPRARRPGFARPARRASRPDNRRWCRRQPPTRSRRSTIALRCGARCRTPGMGFRSARCCCSPRSALPSPSA